MLRRRFRALLAREYDEKGTRVDIQRATEQIAGAVRAYLGKDESGASRIPFHMQRPIILLGPPGVGKTAIVGQIADELGINFVAYSITHHTRQSALGLPYISTRTYGGRACSITEYTMSEIIAATYDAMEASGVKEGILFLDEVNCVSETLAPSMLQFLQYKTFGQHRLPEGWIIVSAGNPPEYNRAARNFDPVTMDRLKRIDVEPDVGVWQIYALAHGVHPAIIGYLDVKPGCFYRVQAHITGSLMVTARGWEDLSRMICAYEAEGIAVDADLIRQYIQDPEIAEDFTSYYELFAKYRDDYRVGEIVGGHAEKALVDRAAAAPFDERIVLLSLLQDAVLGRIHGLVEDEEVLRLVRTDVLEALGRAGADSGADAGADPGLALAATIERVREEDHAARWHKGLVSDKLKVKAKRLALLERLRNLPAAKIKAAYNDLCDAHADSCETAARAADNAFAFLEEAYGEGQEMLILVTKLSGDTQFVKFAAEYPCERYTVHSESLLFSERSLDLMKEIDAMDA